VHPRQLRRSAPVSVCWSPIVRCNLACPHCLDDKSVAEGDRRARAAVAARIAAAGVLGVDISGGEPLLLPDLPALARQLAAAGRAVSVTTNGWHLERRAHELLGHVDAVRVSLDGADAAGHDRWRARGSFARAVAGLRACAQLGIPVQIQAVLMASTVPWAQGVVDLAAGLGVRGVTFLQMLPIGEGARLAAAESLTDDEARTVLGGLMVPGGLPVRLRTRSSAGGFTVVRADGAVWRNGAAAREISRVRALADPSGLALTSPDGSA
jgi:MoaA/NifB/PqqE/SkfB family radical SAM enzyme